MPGGSRWVGLRGHLRRRPRAVVVVAVVAVLLAVPAVGAARVGRVANRSAASRTVPPVLTAQADLPRLGGARAVESDDVGDPFVLPAPAGVTGDPAARYVLFWTTDWNSNVPTAVSPDMVHWRRVADSLPILPVWALPSKTMTWAPSAQRVAGGWVLYFNTVDAANGLECIGRAFSANPAGPYADRSRAPLICQHDLGGSIDPSVVREPAGGRALVWKSNGNGIGRPVAIWEQQLTTNGLVLRGQRHRLLAAGQAWERGNVEGPAVVAAGRGGWWLFYSGGSWQSNTYDTGVAWCRTLSGPCRPSVGPWLTGTATAVSPGGFDTFVDGRGRLWASYSVFPSRPASSEAAMEENRVLEIAPVLFH